MTSPIPCLSDEAYKEAQNVIKIQQCLLDLNKNTYSSAIDIVMESDYVLSEEKVEELAHHFIVSVKYRVKSVAIYADLVQFLKSQSSDFPALEKLSTFIIDEVLAEITSERVGTCAMQLILFISKCFIRLVYTNAEIMQFIRKNIQSKNARQVPVLHIFSHFCYLIDELDPPLYQQYLKILDQIAKNFPNSPVCLFLDEIKGWRKNNWFSLKAFLAHDYNGLTLEGAVISDDLEAIQLCARQPDFSPNGCMQTNLFTPSHMLETNPTIIQYAAFFGAVKCFNFLLQLGADLFVETYKNCSTVKFASAGGNMKIIQTLDKANSDFQGSSHYAALYSNYDLLVWAIENKDKNLYTIDPSLGLAFECAATSNFIKGLLFFLEKGIEINVNITGTNPLFYACVFGQTDAIKLLLSHKDINPDMRDAQGVFF